MSDFNSSLPVRTEENGDVAIKVVDGTITSQTLTVNADGSLNITDNAGSLTVDGTVELGATTLAALESVTVQNPSGASAVNIQDGGNSITVDGTVELGATTLAALESITVQNGTGGAAVNIQDGGNSITVDATDLDIRDLTFANDKVGISDGTDILEINSDGSLNVVVQEDVGTEVTDFLMSAAVAGGGTQNHDKVFATASKLYQVLASGSGKIKAEVQIETGASTGIFNTVMVGFNSTATPNVDLSLNKYAAIPLGAIVRVIRTNRDVTAQDLYSTIVAIEG